MYDAVHISDTHIGAALCRTDMLVDFLQNLPPTKRLILNGDILQATDYRLKKKHWSILSKLRKLSDKLDLIWVSGNHDYDAENVAHLIGATWYQNYEYVSGGKVVLSVHGDMFDSFLTTYPVLTNVANFAYLSLQSLSAKLAATLKHKTKTYLRNNTVVQEKALKYAKKLKADFIVCGHTHMAVAASNYFNTGSWTDYDCYYLTACDGKLDLKKVAEPNA